MSYSSFINERTVEYSLINELNKILSQKYNNFIPFYYWKSREGTNLSINSSLKKMKVIGVFARRPKTTHPKANSILIKLNYSIIDQIQILNELGINSIVGATLVNSLESLNDQSRKHFYSINEKIDDEQDKYIKYQLSDIQNPQLDSGIKLLSEKDILSIIESQDEYLWPDIVNKINSWRMLKSRRNHFHSYMFMGGYKPFFFLVS